MNNNNSNNSSNNSSNNNSNNSSAKVKKNASNSNPVKTSIMDLEKLQIEYNSQLNEYKQAVANYVNYLQQNENSSNTTTNYATVQGNAFWGSGQAGTQSVYTGGTLEQCQALCSSTTNCSGATFNPTSHGQPMCWLRSGEGQLVPALDTDNAIIPQSEEYLLTIESINNKLITTNQQIQNIIDKSEPIYNSIQTKNEEKNQELVQNYRQLTYEREKIAKMLKKYENLDESQIQGELKITKNYYSYILLVIIAVGVVAILYKFSNVFTGGETGENNGNSEFNIQTGGELSENTSVFLLIIIVVILVANYYTTITSTTINIGSTTYNGIASIFSNITNFFSLSDNF